MYQPLPRKYRPQTFHAVVGQDSIVTTLKNALKFQRVAHAYLFCGSRGTGKTTLARVFAKALNCQKLGAEFEPCNLCPSCQEITAGRSMDVLEIDGASNRGIDDIRQINETVGYASSSGKYKIYIIDEVHMLTKEAFNALLKTLEEPPSNVKFFFATTEPHKVLPTIISRCQRFDLSRIPTQQIVTKLKEISQDLSVSIADDALELIAHLAEGGLRDAESLLDQLICYTEGPISYEGISQMLGLSPRKTYFQIDQAIASDDYGFAFQLASEVFSTGKDVSCFLDGLMEHFRTILALKLNQPLSSYLNETDRKNYVENGRLYTEELCLYILDYLIQWSKELSKTPFKRVSLEIILLHLIRSKKRISVTTLVRRLHELSQVQSQTPIKDITTLVSKKEEQKTSSNLEEKLLNALKNGPEIYRNDLKSQESRATLHQTVDIGLQPSPGIEPVEDRDDSITQSEELSRDLRTEQAPISKWQGKNENKNLKINLPVPKEEKESSSLGYVSTGIVSVNDKHAESENHPTALSSNPTPTTPKVDLQPPLKKEEIGQGSHQIRYDTILRFAAVELEGVVRKD